MPFSAHNVEGVRSYRRRLPHLDAPGRPAFVTWRLCGSLPREPEVASLVTEQLRKVTADGLCLLDAYVVMPNHVHVLWTPQVALADLMRQVKGPTACDANRLLGRTGEPFWQQEYFDRIVRSDAEFARIRRYIEWNPVNAALVARLQDFPWSGARVEAGLKPRAG